MKTLPTPTDTAPMPAPALDAPSASHATPRLSHLFRASLKAGRIHPLYLPIVRYRNARACE